MSFFDELFTAIHFDDFDKLKSLIDNDTVHLYDKNNESPIFYAVSANKIKYVKYILQFNPCLNNVNNKNYCLLDIAFFSNNKYLYMLLIKYGAKCIKPCKRNNVSKLSLCFRMQSKLLAKFLLSHGNITISDLYISTTNCKRNIQIYKYIYKNIKNKERNKNILWITWFDNNFKLFKFLLQKENNIFYPFNESYNFIYDKKQYWNENYLKFLSIYKSYFYGILLELDLLKFQQFQCFDKHLLKVILAYV